MSKRSRGPALIINNENFNDKSLTRTGSKVDKNNLNDLLDEFGFQVKSFFWVGFWSWPSFFKSQPTSFVGLTAHATLTSGLELFKLFLLFPFWSNKWVKENWASTFDSITYRSESETKVLRGKLIFYLHIVVRSNLIKVSTKSNLTANELLNAVEHFANQDHSESEMVVIAIMSHGVNGGFIQVKLLKPKRY